MRETRLKRNMSLRSLAQSSGASKSMISDIERGAKVPTIALLAGIAEALNVSLSALVEDRLNQLPESPQVVRMRDRATITDRTGVQRVTLGGQYAGGTVEFVRFKLPRRTVSGTFAAHARGTLERIYLERGTLQVQFGAELVTLRAGDTLLYEATVPHSFANVSDKVAIVFLVIERQ
ncbi:MAG TPA: XRE family transcriptional regulator [Candidatus Tumulicola sp.]